jgi:ribosomal protein S27E
MPDLKLTVEVWGYEADTEVLRTHFHSDFLKHVGGHTPNFELMSEVFDNSAEIVTCQACGMKFSPSLSECPDCGLVYF